AAMQWWRQRSCRGWSVSTAYDVVVPAKELMNLSQLRPHPEEPERSEGVSKDGRESELAAMVRDGALCAPPHHEAEHLELVLNRQDLKDSQPRRRGPIATKLSAHHAGLAYRDGTAYGSPPSRGRHRIGHLLGCGRLPAKQIAKQREDGDDHPRL